MKTIRLDRALRELIYEHNCVTVPSFGSFILRESQASANKFTGDIRPSGQTIFFNNAITADDGILANFYRENLGITYSKALEYIQDDTEQIVRSLRERRNFPFGNIGNFFLNAEGKVFFLPSGALNISKKTFGLNVFRLEELMNGNNPDIMFLPHPDLLRSSEENEPASLIPSHSAEEELQEAEVITESPAEPIMAMSLEMRVEEATVAEEAEIEEIAAPEEPLVVEESVHEEPQLQIEEVPIRKLEPTAVKEAPHTEPKVKPKEQVLARSAASLLVLLTAGGIYIGAQKYGPGFLDSGPHSHRNMEAEAVTVINTDTNASAGYGPHAQALEQLQGRAGERGSGTTDNKGLLENSDASLDDLGFEATVITNARNFLGELRTKPGDYYLVGGTYLGESIALNECMRWKKLGVDATFARVENSQMKKVLLGRYTREQDALVFAAQLPKLDGKDLKIQVLNVNY